MRNNLIGLCIFIIPLLNACHKPQSFEYREVKNMKLEHVGFNKTTVTMDVFYYNPNSFSVNLKKVDCRVSLNQNYLGNYLLDTTIHIAGKSVFSVPVSVSFNMLDVVKKGFNIFLNKEALIGIKGITRVGKSGIYFNVPIQYESKYKLPIPFM